MQTMPSSPPKPVSEQVRLEITRLPDLTLGRRLFRWVLLVVVRLVVRLCVRCRIW